MSIGVGVGIPFGGLGLNYEYRLNDYAALIMGLGFVPENVGYNAGVRFYYPKPTATFRGRLSVLYGVNAIEDNIYTDKYETQTGLSVGPGLSWFFSKNLALDVDFLFTNYKASEGFTEKGPSTKISLGIRRAF
mgnify:FL=1